MIPSVVWVPVLLFLIPATMEWVWEQNRRNERKRWDSSRAKPRQRVTGGGDGVARLTHTLPTEHLYATRRVQAPKGLGGRRSLRPCQSKGGGGALLLPHFVSAVVVVSTASSWYEYFRRSPFLAAAVLARMPTNSAVGLTSTLSCAATGYDPPVSIRGRIHCSRYTPCGVQCAAPGTSWTAPGPWECSAIGGHV